MGGGVTEFFKGKKWKTPPLSKQSVNQIWSCHPTRNVGTLQSGLQHSSQLQHIWRIGPQSCHPSTYPYSLPKWGRLDANGFLDQNTVFFLFFFVDSPFTSLQLLVRWPLRNVWNGCVAIAPRNPCLRHLWTNSALCWISLYSQSGPTPIKPWASQQGGK